MDKRRWTSYVVRSRDARMVECSESNGIRIRRRREHTERTTNIARILAPNTKALESQASFQVVQKSGAEAEKGARNGWYCKRLAGWW